MGEWMLLFAAVLSAMSLCGAADVVSYKGFEYRTLDQTSPTYPETWSLSALGCQDVYMALPAGWRISPDDVDARAVIEGYRWGTNCMAMATGVAVWTASASGHGDWTGGPGAACRTDVLSIRSEVNVFHYKINCGGAYIRILLRRPCAPGSFQLAEMETYTERASPMCPRKCPAGTFSEEGASSCSPCPTGWTTDGEGSAMCNIYSACNHTTNTIYINQTVEVEKIVQVTVSTT